MKQNLLQHLKFKLFSFSFLPFFLVIPKKPVFVFFGSAGVNVEESSERSVEPVRSQYRQQGSNLFGGWRFGLPGQHTDVSLSDQLTCHHRERRRNPSKCVQSGCHTRRL